MHHVIATLWPEWSARFSRFLCCRRRTPNLIVETKKCRTSLLLAAARSRRAGDKLNISRVRFAWTRFFPLRSRHGWPERV